MQKNSKVVKFDEKGNMISDSKKEVKRKNVDFKISDSKLTITIDLKKVDSLTSEDISSSGKTYLVSTTGGNIALPGELSYLKLGLNLFASKDYIDGKRAMDAGKKALQADSKKDAEKDAKISMLEAELLEMKAMMKALLAK